MRDEYLVFGSPDIRQADIDEVVRTLQSGWIGSGPRVEHFERAFRELTGSRHAIAVNSCTAALHLSMIAMGIGPGDEVITTPMTFAATANAVIHAGATPVFADCDRRTQNILPEAIERAITPRTKAILPVHFAGRMCEMDAITAIASRHGLQVLEDCAHAIETTANGRHAGTFGRVGCFSFYVTKTVVTGEGGMIITDDDDLAARLMRLRLHGLSRDAWKRFGATGYRHYEVEEPGWKCNLTDIAASLGIHQLARCAETRLRRETIWRAYLDAFSDLPLGLPPPAAHGTEHALHLFTVMLDLERAGFTRDELLGELHARRIGSGVHYRAVHLQPWYRNRFGFRSSDFPNAEWISDRTLSLPLGSRMTDRDVTDVIDAVRAICRRDTALASGGTRLRRDA